MAYVHIAHDCMIGDNNIFANNTSLAGHVVVYDNVNLGGFTGVAQFCRIGSYSFVGKAALVTKDIPPFLLIAGPEPTAAGLNVVGLRRHGFAAETVSGLKRAYKLIFRQGLLLKDVLEKLDELLVATPEVKLFIDFIRDSERGIIR
jgi:UDP-N-acetylglucosamine acyltransferase